jgi:carbamoyltransferase
LADARSKKMQSYLNLATKFRESFRPFAPICLKEDAHLYFNQTTESPYMLVVDGVREEHIRRFEVDPETSVTEWVNMDRSVLPAITHVDYSARIQTVDTTRNPRIHDLLTQFKEITGHGIMVNTSFNVRSEPIVCSPADAYRCFMRTGMDFLCLENFVLDKTAQPPWQETKSWQEEFGLD